MNNYLKLFQNKNKLAFVVGGHGLIGKEICKALLSSGCKVIVLDIKSKKNSLLKKKLYNHYLDCSNLKALKNNIDKVIKKYGTPKIFINCSYPKSHDWLKNSFKDITEKSYKYNIDVHLNSFVWLAKYLADSMKKRKIKGSIIQLSSIYGVVAQDLNIYKGTNMKESMTYSIIKGGINNLTKQMASYYGQYQIRCNTLCPGGIQTKNHDLTFLKNYKNKVPLKRFCKATDVAASALFLSSDASSYITGSTIMVDGGWTII